MIDIHFNFYSDSRWKDPDSHSPTLKKYHKYLWEKFLPNGNIFYLNEKKEWIYLYNKSNNEFFLWSDAITNSYRDQKRKQAIILKIPAKAQELFDLGSTIGAYILFPNNKIDGKYTINQARWVHGMIDDRFDITLECIRLFYEWKESPLFEVLERYKNFFDLFWDFKSYIHFFLLEDLVDETYQIKFYLPFDHFKTRPSITSVEEYLIYHKNVTNFINARNKRIERYCFQNL